MLAGLPRERFLEVRYEDLCRDPEGVCRRVFGLLRLTGVADPRSFRTVEQHVLGNAMRLGSDSVIQVDARWRREIGAEDLATFERIAGRTNRRLGYV